MNYEDAKAYQQQLENNLKVAGDAIKAFDRTKNAIGLTPDHVKATTEWKTAKTEYYKAFNEFRNFNIRFNKTFKKEINAETKRYAKKGATYTDGESVITVRDFNAMGVTTTDGKGIRRNVFIENYKEI